ncbi:hypothetical protein BDW66DRAFT_144041 [Aspergillus desertorum]
MTLHSASSDGTLTRSSLQKHLVLVEIDALDDHGFTALALAVRNGHPSVVKLLLQSGASADKPVRDGRTPLYLAANARQNRARVVQLLLSHDPKPDIDASSPEWNNETPLMVAITQGRDPEVVRLLVEAGASVTKTNDRGETAVSLADQSTNPAIREALSRRAQWGWGSALAQLLVSAILFALAYADRWPGMKEIIQNVIRSAYNQANPALPGSMPPAGTDIDDPQTVEEFKHNITNIIQKNGLDDFFPPNDPYVQSVAEKAAAFRKAKANPLANNPPFIMKAAAAALYQPVLYIDDSGSMANGGRMQRARDLVALITEVATKFVEVKRGVHLRFINKDDSTANNLRADEVRQRMTFDPEGWTQLGTNLNKKILQPMVYDVIAQGALQRPFLILTITDGVPSKENRGEFRKAIVRCKKELRDRGYQKDAVYFDLSQVGNDPEAIEFIESLNEDASTKDVLHLTAENTDPLFETLNEDADLSKIELWVADKLNELITYRR